MQSVHAELIYNLDADSMVNAIVQFAARRTGMRRFTSDHGMNLVGTNNVLKSELQAWNASSTQELQQGDWSGNSFLHRCPIMADVGSVSWDCSKKHLASISTGDVLHVDVFNAAIVEAEGILNQRPLTLCIITIHSSTSMD